MLLKNIQQSTVSLFDGFKTKEQDDFRYIRIGLLKDGKMPQCIQSVELTCFTVYALYIIIKSFAIFHLSRHDAIFIIMKYAPHRLQDITINPDNIFNTECEQEYSVCGLLTVL